MRAVIQKVLASEAEAKRLIFAARSEAEHIISQARAQSREISEEARRAAQNEAEQIVAAAIASGQHDKSEQLNRIAAEIRSTITIDEKIRQIIVTAGVHKICGREQEAGS